MAGKIMAVRDELRLPANNGDFVAQRPCGRSPTSQIETFVTPHGEIRDPNH
jgi:hypothetical protein